jgi:hypothetical protein
VGLDLLVAFRLEDDADSRGFAHETEYAPFRLGRRANLAWRIQTDPQPKTQYGAVRLGRLKRPKRAAT